MTPNDFLILRNVVRSGDVKPKDVMIQKYVATILSAPLNDEGLRLLDLAALPVVPKNSIWDKFATVGALKLAARGTITTRKIDETLVCAILRPFLAGQ